MTERPKVRSVALSVVCEAFTLFFGQAETGYAMKYPVNRSAQHAFESIGPVVAEPTITVAASNCENTEQGRGGLT